MDSAKSGSKPEHALLPPSGWEWWWNCPGVLSVPEVVPKPPPGPAAVEGIRLHELACQRWSDRGRALSTLPEADTRVLGPYWEHLEGLDNVPHFEVRVFPFNESVVEHLPVWGTADAVVASPVDRPDYVDVIDLKTGAGIWVEPDTIQLQIYALGALRQWSRPRVRTTIVQPLCERPGLPTVRSRDWTAEELLWDFHCELHATVIRLKAADPAALCPGDHCRYCPRQLRCVAQRSRLHSIVKTGFQSSIDSLNPVEIGWILDDLDKLDAWSKGVRESALQLALAGERIPGRKLVAGETHRRWRAATTAETLSTHLNVDLADVLKTTLLSPAQLERTIAKGVDLSDWTEKPEGVPKLVPLSDKREALNSEIVQKAFKEEK